MRDSRSMVAALPDTPWLSSPRRRGLTQQRCPGQTRTSGRMRDADSVVTNAYARSSSTVWIGIGTPLLASDTYALSSSRYWSSRTDSGSCQSKRARGGAERPSSNGSVASRTAGQRNPHVSCATVTACPRRNRLRQLARRWGSLPLPNTPQRAFGLRDHEDRSPARR